MNVLFDSHVSEVKDTTHSMLLSHLPFSDLVSEKQGAAEVLNEPHVSTDGSTEVTYGCESDSDTEEPQGGCLDEHEQNTVGQREFAHIPLPHAEGSGMAENLFRENIISEAVHREFETRLALGVKQAAVYLLAEWKQADDAGRRMHNPPSVFQPDTALYPGLLPSSFRPDVLQLVCAGEQKETVDFLLDGFRNGFQLFELPAQIQSIEYKNMRPPNEEAEAAMRKCVSVESELGCIGRRPEHMKAFVCSPIFPVAKKKDGLPTGKFRQAHHLSRENEDHDSVNQFVKDEDAEIQYETVLDAVSATFDLKHKWRANEAPSDKNSGTLGTDPPSDHCMGEDSEPSKGQAKPVSGAREPDIRATKKDAARAFRIMPIDPRYYALLGF